MSEAQAAGLVRSRADRGRTAGQGPKGLAAARTLAVLSGKGGVGKSAIATNVGLACARAGTSTLLIDGDAGLANADLLLGLVPPHTWTDVVEGRVSCEEAILRGPHGLDLLVTGSGARGVPSLCDALDELRLLGASARLGRHACTVLDLGAGVGADVIGLASRCDAVWLVMTPEPTSLADAYTTVRRLENARPGHRIELVVNRATDPVEAEHAARSLQRLTRRFLGCSPRLRAILPEDPAMGRAVLRQEPVLETAPRSRVARGLVHLAETWLEEAGASDRQTIGSQTGVDVPG